jgi:hypothetical protein
VLFERALSRSGDTPLSSPRGGLRHHNEATLRRTRRDQAAEGSHSRAPQARYTPEADEGGKTERQSERPSERRQRGRRPDARAFFGGGRRTDLPLAKRSRAVKMFRYEI